ncbi:MAG: hypothetical protein KIT73_12110 [Burkholderiales bacterium]|nr:hypothetical protein [Burkholderiales bacterium]
MVFASGAPNAPPATATPADRTIVCSVLFLDIADYAHRPVAEQVALKERFNDRIATAIRPLPPDSRIILDTDNGAAITFLGAATDALRVALMLREVFDREGSGDASCVRMGLNVGPVRSTRDANGQPAIVGDGIDVAERIMAFAAAGQILASRAFMDRIVTAAPRHRSLFTPQGVRTDSLVRAHEVLEVGPAPASIVTDRPTATTTAFTAHRRDWFWNHRIAWVVAGVSSLALTLVVLVGRIPPTDPAASAATASTPTPPPPATQGAVVELDNLLIDTLPDDAPSAGTAAPHAAAARIGTEAARPHPRAEPSVVARKPVTPPVVAPATAAPRAPAHAASEQATIALAVAPWGEVWINGVRIGVTPPLDVVELPPGRVELEIRNGSLPAYAEVINVTPGQRLRVKHRF